MVASLMEGIFGACLLRDGWVEVGLDKGTVTTVIAFFLRKVVPTPAFLVLSMKLVNLVSSYMSMVLFKMLLLCWSLEQVRL